LARTRDWLAPWKVAGAPGKFQILIDGKALKNTLGTVTLEPGRYVFAMVSYQSGQKALMKLKSVLLKPVN
jgi:hypothetical protein